MWNNETADGKFCSECGFQPIGGIPDDTPVMPVSGDLAQHAVASKLPVGGQRNCDEHKEYLS